MSTTSIEKSEKTSTVRVNNALRTVLARYVERDIVVQLHEEIGQRIPCTLVKVSPLYDAIVVKITAMNIPWAKDESTMVIDFRFINKIFALDGCVDYDPDYCDMCCCTDNELFVARVIPDLVKPHEGPNVHAYEPESIAEVRKLMGYAEDRDHPCVVYIEWCVEDTRKTAGRDVGIVRFIDGHHFEIMDVAAVRSSGIIAVADVKTIAQGHYTWSVREVQTHTRGTSHVDERNFVYTGEYFDDKNDSIIRAKNDVGNYNGDEVMVVGTDVLHMRYLECDLQPTYRQVVAYKECKDGADIKYEPIEPEQDCTVADIEYEEISGDSADTAIISTAEDTICIPKPQTVAALVQHMVEGIDMEHENWSINITRAGPDSGKKFHINFSIDI